VSKLIGPLDGNPYWDELVASGHRGGLALPYEVAGFCRWPGSFMCDRDHRGRDELAPLYAWAIPSPGSIAWIVDVLDGTPLLEVGAGRGYWAALLAQAGIDVVAFDHHPPQHGGNRYVTERRLAVLEAAPTGESEDWSVTYTLREAADGGEIPVPVSGSVSVDYAAADYPAVPVYYPVGQGDHQVVGQHPGRAVFLCWPDYSTSFGYEVASRVGPGQLLLYVGESAGGCNADDAFFGLLDTEFTDLGEYDQQPVWEGIHDRLIAYRRDR
jgi:SAM-dependent methyltransferase